MKKKTISLILVISMIMTIFTTSIVTAETNAIMVDANNDFKILSTQQQDNLQIVEVEENGEVTKISIYESDKQVETVIVNEESGESDTLILNKETNQMYSSITGSTIDLNDEINNIEETYENDGGILLKAAPASGFIKISYSKINSAVGKAASASSVAAVVLSMVAGAVKHPVLTNVALLVSGFAAVLSLIATKLNNGSKSTTSGIKAGYEPVRYTKHQAGQVFYTYKVSVGKY